MRVLVCGGRDYADCETLFATLDALHRSTPITCIIEGEARGADTLARHWAETHQVPCAKFPAEWTRYGRGAGMIRNKRMLVEGKPDLILAFHDNIATSKGTKNMLHLAGLAGVTSRLVEK